MPESLRIRRCHDEQFVRYLHRELMPTDQLPTRWDAAWVAWDGKVAVGFATAELTDWKTTVFLQRAAVRPGYRARGLQRRLIRIRERWARQQGIRWVVTYTVYKNYPSIVNLLRCGYRFHVPEYAWVGREVHYFLRKLF